MDYVIDIQGFRNGNKKFVPKEVAVVALQSRVIGHWIVKPSSKFKDLPFDVKNSNNYCTLNIHGIEWNDGEITLQKLESLLSAVVSNSTRIYACGSEKTLYIESVTSRQIINLEVSEVPSYAELGKQFPDVMVCFAHSFAKFKDKKEFCALHRAYLLRKWLHANLPHDWQEHLSEPSSEILYESIVKYASAKRQEKGYSSVNTGFDELDSCNLSTDDSDSSLSSEEEGEKK